MALVDLALLREIYQDTIVFARRKTVTLEFPERYGDPATTQMLQSITMPASVAIAIALPGSTARPLGARKLDDSPSRTICGERDAIKGRTEPSACARRKLPQAPSAT